MGHHTLLPRVAYIVRRFPVLSQTFVLAEVRDHFLSGLDVDVIAIRKRSDSATAISVDEIPPLRITYLGIEFYWPKLALKLLLSLTNRSSIQAAFRSLRHAPRPLAIIGLQRAILASQFAKICPDYDIFHCHFGDLGEDVAAALIAAKAQTKLITTIHAQEITKGQSPDQMPLSNLIKRADLLLPVNSLWAQRLADAGIDPRKITTHHMGVDASALKPVRPAPSRTVAICTTGRMVEKKGLRYTIAALRILLDRRPDIHVRMDVVGSGPLYDAIAVQIIELGLTSHIILHGGLSHGETLKMVANCDIFVLPSVTAADGDMEGIPVALMEAMAFEKPVISTWHSGIPELVENEVSGILCQERSAEQISRALERLCDSLETRDAMGVQGRRRVMSEFETRSLGRLLRSHYNKLASPIPLEL